MKKAILFLIAVNFLCLNSIRSQIIAGSGSSGLLITNPNVNLSNSSVGNTVSADFDIDCDSIADCRITIHKGPTAIDGANTAYLYILNPAIEICTDSVVFGMFVPHYYNLNDTLLCTPGNTWSSDTIYSLGNYGCMECTGPFVINNSYIAYKNNLTSQIGWFKITFDLDDGGASSIPITLTAPQVLSPCTQTALMSPPAGSGSYVCGPFSFDYTTTQPSCDGSCDGSITITNIQGGTPGYTYLWSAGQSTPSLTGACGGTYQFEIMDAMGVSCSANFVVQNPPPMTFSLSVNNASCNGVPNGNICSANLSGGSGPYSYQWSPSGASTSCLNNIGNGTYTLCVTSGEGCVACSTAVVNDPPPIQVQELMNPASCSSCCDGEIQLYATGGSGGGYTYTLDGVSVNDHVLNVCPGQHTYCVMDWNGCNYCDTMMIAYPISLKENNASAKLNLYPNPTKNEVFVDAKLLSNEKGVVSIYDLNGKLLLSDKLDVGDNKVKFNMEDFASGVYYYRVFINGGNSVLNKLK